MLTRFGFLFVRFQDYENNLQFSDGMMGSQAMLGSRNQGPQLPGMENLGADAVVTGGLDMATDIPAVRDGAVGSTNLGHRDLTSCTR